MATQSVRLLDPLADRLEALATVRVIYGFDGTELLISVLRVGHRREIYRK